MKAREVDGLDPDGSLAGNARRIVETRLRELESFVPRALDPAEVGALHDMRIAAKRLRYVLELTASAFGRAAADGARAARDLQDVLGEVHDCDELLARLHESDHQLDAAIERVVARRERAFERFARDWERIDRDALGDTLLEGLRGPRPGISPSEPAPAARADGGAA